MCRVRFIGKQAYAGCCVRRGLGMVIDFGSSLLIAGVSAVEVELACLGGAFWCVFDVPVACCAL